MGLPTISLVTIGPIYSDCQSDATIHGAGSSCPIETAETGKMDNQCYEIMADRKNMGNCFIVKINKSLKIRII
jgi:hypothetical protein